MTWSWYDVPLIAALLCSLLIATGVVRLPGSRRGRSR